MNPGQIYKFSIYLWSTSNVFPQGNRLLGVISSSNFPRFDRNLSTGMAASFESQHVVATCSSYQDSAHPSKLLLQVAECR